MTLELDFPAARAWRGRWITLPLPATTDLSPLAGRRLLCLVDEDNLRLSLQAYRQRLSYRCLYQRLHGAVCELSAWAVLTSPAGDDRRGRYLSQRGWQVIAIPQEVALTVHGPTLKANADMDLCFAAGQLLHARYDALLIGSGDGDLCLALARGARRTQPGCAVYTLAVPGSASQRLSRYPELFTQALRIGCDLTHPLPGPYRGAHSRDWPHLAPARP